MLACSTRLSMLRPSLRVWHRSAARGSGAQSRRLASAGHAIQSLSSRCADITLRDDIDIFSFLKARGRWSEAAPDKVALTCLASGRSLGFRELEGRILGAAHALRTAGFKQGDVLNIHLHNCEHYVVSFFAVAALGGVITTSNPVYTAAELALQHDDSDARWVLSSHEYRGVVEKASAAAGSRVRTVFWIEEANCWVNAPSSGAPICAERPIEPTRDLLVLPYSSGTTGRPKGVMLSHANLVNNVQQCLEDADVNIDVHGADTVLALLPLFHIYGMTVLMMLALAQQARLLLMPKFEPLPFLSALEKHRVNVAFIVPPVALFLAKHPAVGEHDLSALRFAFCAAAPLDASTQQDLSARLRIPVRQGWGMSELSPIGTLAPTLSAPVAGSVGVAVPNTRLKVIDPESGADLPVGSQGELCVAGPQVMLGYLNRPDATAATMTADGFLRTGDMVSIDKDGNVFVRDRLKELIKVKGMQVRTSP